MNISLDYDGTFTKDPEMWAKCIEIWQASLNYVYCITSRKDEFFVRQMIQDQFGKFNFVDPITIIFCNFEPKLEVVRKLGLNIDIWIDDDPKGITEGY